MASRTADDYGVVDENGVLWSASSTPGTFNSIPEQGVTTIWESLQAGARKYGPRRVVGWRTVLTREVQDIDGKALEKVTLGPYNYMTYDEYMAKVDRLGAAMVKRFGLKKGDRVVIFAETQKEWLLAAYACWRHNLVVVTVYSTLSEDGAYHGISQTEASVIITDSKLVKAVGNIAQRCPQLKHVVTILADQPLEPIPAIPGVSVTSMDTLFEEDPAAVAPSPPAPSDVAVIMYTSGTTGVPKGVVIQHSAIVSIMAGTLSPQSTLMQYKPPLGPEADDSYMAYLPLAHILELSVEASLIYHGVRVCYGSPQTLTANSLKVKQTKPPQVGDAAAAQPTVMVFAPAVMDRIYSTIMSRVNSGSALKRALFNAALRSGLAAYDRGEVRTPEPWNRIVFSAPQKLLGGKVRIMLAGSAPVSPDVQKFMQVVFNSVVRQGYGLSETCAGTTMPSMYDNDVGQCGPPQPQSCLRLRDWPEGNYHNSDLNDPKIGMRRGEILVGGPAVAQGYFVPQRTPGVPSGPCGGVPSDVAAAEREVADKNKTDFVIIDGIRYFCSGDIGQFTPKGQIQIVDRKKDLVKLQQGEYVALSKVENVLKNSKYTAIPMIYAASDMNYCIALLCPQPSALKGLAASLGEPSESMQAMCANERVNAGVLADLKAQCKAKKLATFETPAKVILIPEEWTPEADLLTVTLKLKRPNIVARHKAEIDSVYHR